MKIFVIKWFFLPKKKHKNVIPIGQRINYIKQRLSLLLRPCDLGCCDRIWIKKSCLICKRPWLLMGLPDLIYSIRLRVFVLFCARFRKRERIRSEEHTSELQSQSNLL